MLDENYLSKPLSKIGGISFVSANESFARRFLNEVHVCCRSCKKMGPDDMNVCRVTSSGKKLLQVVAVLRSTFSSCKLEKAIGDLIWKLFPNCIWKKVAVHTLPDYVYKPR